MSVESKSVSILFPYIVLFLLLLSLYIAKCEIREYEQQIKRGEKEEIMIREDIPDRDVHCRKCVAALSDFERCQLFNRCAFCDSRPRTISKHSYMLYAKRQVQIFDLKLRLKEKMGEDASYHFLGVLGNLGVTGENDLAPATQKEVIRALKKLLRRKEDPISAMYNKKLKGKTYDEI